MRTLSEAYLLEISERDLSPETLDEFGCLRVLPASFYRQTTLAERNRLCVEYGLYCLPTTELVEYLRTLIRSRRAIEIGAGNGVLAKALGIRATDNRMQELPRYSRLYAELRQATVRYGDNVERLDAAAAVDLHKPEVVIGAWVTHRYDPMRHEAGGNDLGIEEERIIQECETYVVIGNERVHRGKSIWSLPHTIEFPEWLYSRSVNGSRDFIAVWNRASKAAVMQGNT